MEVYNAQLDSNGNLVLVEVQPDCDINGDLYVIENQPQGEDRFREPGTYCM